MTDTISNDAVLTLNADGIYDISLTDEGDIETKAFFDTALLISIFAERRAEVSEVPESELRRGWIGNESTPGFEIGSKIWLYEQARLNRDTLNGIKTEAFNALTWLTDNNYVVSHDTNTVLNENKDIELIIDLFRSNSEVENKVFTLWENSGA